MTLVNVVTIWHFFLACLASCLSILSVSSLSCLFLSILVLCGLGSRFRLRRWTITFLLFFGFGSLVCWTRVIKANPGLVVSWHVSWRPFVSLPILSYSYVSCTYIRFEAPGLHGGFVHCRHKSTSTAIPIIPSFSRMLSFTPFTLLHFLYCNLCRPNGQNLANGNSNSNGGDHNSSISAKRQLLYVSGTL